MDAGVPGKLLDDPDYVPVHGHLADAARFENSLFRISPREAEMIDPQQRLMLETVWTALEDAGVAPLRETVTTAVYASAAPSGYLRKMLARGELDPATLDDALHGTEPDFMASRIAYKLGLTGPALGVQCACSSSLVAVHMAVRALLDGDCDQAVVAAASIAFPQAGYLHIPGGVLSASGACRPFAAAADGTVAGSGVACVVLRRLADALADGQRPYGVILGTATNNDGAAKAGYYAPSVAGQEAVITAALRAARADASSIGYLEAHGTGTQIGDTIEWAAACAALRTAGAAPGQVAVGAVKANVGHLDAAAGVANLIAALLVVRDGIVPPIAGFTEPNPMLDTDGAALVIPTEAGPWTGPLPRRVGVSSFGIGGTNVHLVIEQAPDRPTSSRPVPARPRLVVLSAADAAALSRSAARLSAHLAARDPDLADVSRTLVAGRAPLPQRLAVVARTSAEAAERLGTGRGVTRALAGSAPAPAVFLFPGQGSQYPGMSRPFAEALPGFSATLDRCVSLFDPALAARLRRALWDETYPAAEVAATELAQPALFAVGYAAATALCALGLRPAAVAGHSIGEITSACVAHVLDLADAVRLVSARGRAMQGCPEGSMLALGCSQAAALRLVAESGLQLELAAINARESCVVAGPVQAVEKFRALLGDSVRTKCLRAQRAFHSAAIEPALPPLAEAIADITVRSPAIPFAANATGRLLPAGTPLSPGSFVAQARQPVRFAEIMDAIADRFAGAVLVEVGPGETLSTMIDGAALTAVALSPGRDGPVDGGVHAALGELWALGQPISLDALSPDGETARLPGYPFHGPEWIAPEAGVAPASTVPVVPPERPPSPLPAGLTDPSALMTRFWEELLGHSGLDEESDFFELGGDSLLATHLVRRIKQELGVRVPIREMLSGRTLRRQTAILTAQLG